MTIHERLEELRGEYARGQAQMKALEQRQAELHDTLLRISGAIQVLEELLAQGNGNGGGIPQAEARQRKVGSPRRAEYRPPARALPRAASAPAAGGTAQAAGPRPGAGRPGGAGTRLRPALEQGGEGVCRPIRRLETDLVLDSMLDAGAFDEGRLGMLIGRQVSAAVEPRHPRPAGRRQPPVLPHLGRLRRPLRRRPGGRRCLGRLVLRSLRRAAPPGDRSGAAPGNYPPPGAGGRCAAQASPKRCAGAGVGRPGRKRGAGGL